MEVVKKFTLLGFIGISASFCIQSRDDVFYSSVEANQKIFTAYTAKNSGCVGNKTPASFILGRAKISDVNTCIRAIELSSCPDWNREGYIPESCQSITLSLR